MQKNLNPPKQIDCFAELAHAFECDESEAAFDAKLKQIANHRPAPKPESPE